MGRISNFLSGFKKRKSSNKFSSSRVDYKKKAGGVKAIVNRESLNRINKFNEYKHLYDEAKKGYDEEVPQSKRVFNVVYFVAAKDPEFVKELIKNEKNEKLREALKSVFKKYL